VQTERGLEALGGWDGTEIRKQCLTLDSHLSRWTPTGTMPEGRVYGRAEILDRTIYLIGGSTDPADFSRATNRLLAADVENRSAWHDRAPIPGGPRALHASAVAAGRLLVFGGCRSDGHGDLVNLADAYSYEPEKNRWQRLADLPQSVRSLSATAVENRFIYLFGGYVASAAESRTKPLDYGFTPAVYVYDIEMNQYSRTAPLPIAVSDINFAAHSLTLFGAGGEDRNYGRSARTFIGRLGH
jgi:N-acetylneuraminic acid mutarotase